MNIRVALIGDRNPTIVAHRAIPIALEMIAGELSCDVRGEWLHSSTLTGDVARQLESHHAVWCVPGSPYANTAGILAAIRFARESGRPFLGTCGGFQHALLEYAGAIWGVEAPKHQELDSAAADPVIAKLSCSLINVAQTMRLAPGSILARAYGSDQVSEEYQCSYGLNPLYAHRLASGPLRAVAWTEDGDVRGVELSQHAFYVGTLFQPERAALRSVTPPLVREFVRAAIQASR